VTLFPAWSPRFAYVGERLRWTDHARKLWAGRKRYLRRQNEHWVQESFMWQGKPFVFTVRRGKAWQMPKEQPPAGRKNAKLPEHELNWEQYLSLKHWTEEWVLDSMQQSNWAELVNGLIGWIKKREGNTYIPSKVLGAFRGRGVLGWEQ
jgi:hypothetical protein